MVKPTKIKPVKQKRRSVSRAINEEKVKAWKVGMFETTFQELSDNTTYHVDNVRGAIRSGRCTKELEKEIDRAFGELKIPIK